MKYYKDNKGRTLALVDEFEAVGGVPAMTKLFICQEEKEVILRSADFSKHCEKGLFIPFVPIVQNNAGV